MVSLRVMLTAALPTPLSRYVVAELPVRLPLLRPPMDKPNPKLGVGER